VAPANIDGDVCLPGNFPAQLVIKQFPLQARGELFTDVAATRTKFAVEEKELFHIILGFYSAAETAWTARGFS
jgi:hypothetical protein